MKITKISAAAIAISTVAMLASSCRHEGINGNGDRVAVLDFSTTLMSEVQTRATDAENKLERVAVFGLDAKGNVAQTFDVIEKPAQTGNKLTIDARVASLCVIANPKGEHQLSYSNASEFDEVRSDLSKAPASPFAMTCKVTLPADLTAPVKVNLERSIAKLQVKGDKGFTVTSVAVSSTPSFGYLFPKTAAPAFALTDMVGYPEVQGSEVYVGENGIENVTKLSVKGDYQGRPITYNVELKKDGKPVAVKRNTTYQVTITPVDNSTATVDVIVVDWDNVVVDNGTFNPNGTYYSVDFHNHTGFTDGQNPITFVLNQGKKYKLDVIVNSEHGGSDKDNASDGEEEGMPLPTWEQSGITPSGDANNGAMWRWESIMKYSWLKVKEFNQKNSTTIIAVQGLEWNAPGHEHCSSGVITGQFDGNDNARAMAQFEYMFDKNDSDKTGGAKEGWVKSTLPNDHSKTLEGAAWLQKNHPHTSWLVPAHPERQDKWHINHYRDMSNVAPDVLMGFESIPGHQASTQRGGYGNSISYDKTYTFGGVGAQSATVGGLWDALISEGRRFWIIANSDYHRAVKWNGGDFYPGEYQKTYISMNDRTAQGFVDGLRSGNVYTVHGDLIDQLQFSVGSATMGQTLITKNNEVTVTIVVRDPDANNNNTYSSYTNPVLDHIDLIAGKMRDKVAAGTPEYTAGAYADVKVVARFDAKGGIVDGNNITSTKWEDLGDGFRKMTCKFTLAGDTYFRLRGTNHGLNVADETDANGNPLVDAPTANVQEAAASAFSDLWFYSNPIFVKKN